MVVAGCASKRIVAGLVGHAPQTEQIKHRRAHMICVQASRGALPAANPGPRRAPCPTRPPDRHSSVRVPILL